MQNGQLGFLGIGKVVSVITYPVRKLNDVIGDDVAKIASKVREYGCVIVNNDYVVGAAAVGGGLVATPATAAAIKAGAEVGKQGCKALDVADAAVKTLLPPGAPPLPAHGKKEPVPYVPYHPPPPIPPMYPPGAIAYRDDSGFYNVAIPSPLSSTGYKFVERKQNVRSVKIVPRDYFEMRVYPMYRRQGFYQWAGLVAGITLGAVIISKRTKKS